MSKENLRNTFQNRIKLFLNKNIKSLIILSIFIILILFGYFFYNETQKRKEIKLSEYYMQASFEFKKERIVTSKQLLENIINEKHKFYSPLALYFIIDNNLETEQKKIINYFDIILSINSIDKENLNLIKIKKAIFLFEIANEETIISILNPIINSESVWRGMAIKFMSNYFFSKNQNEKANEYIKLLNNKVEK